MYLFIFEDGSMRVGNTITDEDRQSCDDGILDIVRTRIEGMDMFHDQYLEGEWHQIEAI